tara:strand:- start:3754 stop:4569 length:816 start_codon:yes stop_codon:yes gene_type:complete
MQNIGLILKKSIANSFTILNLLLGFSALIFISLSLTNEFNYINIACLLIFIASLIDVCDGKIARKLGTSGEFGKQLDSLADIVSFCLVPSFLLFYYMYDITQLTYVIIISSFPLVFGAIRLAKFNAYPKQSSETYYFGLPTPANAIFICSSILLMNDASIVVIAESSLTYINISDLLKWVLVKLYTINEYIIIIVSMLSSLIMITDINYTKFPIFRFGRNKIYIVLFIIFIIFLFVGILNKQYHIVMLFFVSYYIISGIIKSIIRKINGEI